MAQTSTPYWTTATKPYHFVCEGYKVLDSDGSSVCIEHSKFKYNEENPKDIIGKIYKIEGDLVCGEHGIHFSRDPVNLFIFMKKLSYDIRFFKIEAYGTVIDSENGLKSVTQCIKFIKEYDIYEFILDICKNFDPKKCKVKSKYPKGFKRPSYKSITKEDVDHLIFYHNFTYNDIYDTLLQGANQSIKNSDNESEEIITKEITMNNNEYQPKRSCKYCTNEDVCLDSVKLNTNGQCVFYCEDKDKVPKPTSDSNVVNSFTIIKEEPIEYKDYLFTFEDNSTYLMKCGISLKDAIWEMTKYTESIKPPDRLSFKKILSAIEESEIALIVREFNMFSTKSHIKHIYVIEKQLY